MKAILRTVGVLFILAAVVLFFWQDIRAFYTNNVNDKIISAYETGSAPKVNSLEKWITKTEPEKLNLKENMIGFVKIEAAGINEPLYNGPATEENMKNGVSLVEKGEKLTEQNIAIAGHRVEGAGIRFNYLDRAKIGDVIEIVTNDGTKKYKINDIFNVNPSEIEVLNEHKGKPQELTLITCDTYNPNTLLFEERMIVKAVIME